MLVGERMSQPVITVRPETTVHDALHLMQSERIRRVPVLDHGRLVGMVSMKDLLNASPSPATSLSIWELNYLLSKLTVAQVMTKTVLTIDIETPIEEAARLMADQRVGGLPVLNGNQVIGMITETDLFKIFLELMGARSEGVRVTVILPDTPGQLALLTGAIAKAGGNIVALGTFLGSDATSSEVMIKITDLDIDQVGRLIEPLVSRIADLR